MVTSKQVFVVYVKVFAIALQFAAVKCQLWRKLGKPQIVHGRKLLRSEEAINNQGNFGRDV